MTSSLVDALWRYPEPQSVEVQFMRMRKDRLAILLCISLPCAAGGSESGGSCGDLFRWLPPETLREFNVNGVAVVRNVFAPEELRAASMEVDSMIERLPPRDVGARDKYDDSFANAQIRGPPPRHGGGMLEFHTWRANGAIRDLVFRSRVAELAARMLSSSAVNFFYDQLFVKEPYFSKPTPWHQDQAYYALEGRQIATTWIPMDRIARNVSLRFLIGSHRWGTGRDWLPTRFFNGTDAYEGFTGNLKPLPDIDALTVRDADGTEWYEHDGVRHRIATFEIDVGDILVFQSATLHAAPPQNSPYRRRALALRWLGDDMRWIQKDPHHAIPNSPSPADAPRTLRHGDPIRNEPQTFLLGWRAPAREVEPASTASGLLPALRRVGARKLRMFRERLKR